MEILNELQQDMLTEAFNLGMGKAAASLSEMVQEEILLSVPDIIFMSNSAAAAELDLQSPGNVSGVSQGFNGPFSGEAMLLFPIEKSLELVRLLLQDTVPLENLTEFEEEALNEIGNIILNAGLSSLANFFNLEIMTDLPEFRQGTYKDMLNIDESTSSSEDIVLLLRVDFKLEKHAVDGYVMFLLDAESFNALGDNINNSLKLLNT